MLQVTNVLCQETFFNVQGIRLRPFWGRRRRRGGFQLFRGLRVPRALSFFQIFLVVLELLLLERLEYVWFFHGRSGERLDGRFVRHLGLGLGLGLGLRLALGENDVNKLVFFV